MIDRTLPRTLPQVLVVSGQAKVFTDGDLHKSARAMQQWARIRIDAEWCPQYNFTEQHLTLNGEEV